MSTTPGRVEHRRPGLVAGPVAAEVERVPGRVREHVVEDGIQVGEADRAADRHHRHPGDELLVLLLDLHRSALLQRAPVVLHVDVEVAGVAAGHLHLALDGAGAAVAAVGTGRVDGDRGAGACESPDPEAAGAAAGAEPWLCRLWIARRACRSAAARSAPAAPSAAAVSRTSFCSCWNSAQVGRPACLLGQGRRGHEVEGAGDRQAETVSTSTIIASPLNC